MAVDNENGFARRAVSPGDCRSALGRHAWIVFRQEGTEFLFEPVCREKSRMIRPLVDLRGAYLPEFGVDRSAGRFAFSGYMIGQKRLLGARSTRRTA